MARLDYHHVGPRSGRPGRRQPAETVRFSPGQPAGTSPDEHAPPCLAAFAAVVYLERNDVAAVGGAELRARPASEEDRSVRSADIVHRYDVERADALDVGEAPDLPCGQQVQALLAGQSVELAGNWRVGRLSGRLQQATLGRVEGPLRSAAASTTQSRGQGVSLVS